MALELFRCNVVKVRRVLPSLVVVLSYQISCTWLDHPTSGSLTKELTDQSKHGLALATLSGTSSDLRVRLFDGRKVVLPLQCCVPNTSANIQWNRIVMIGMTVPSPASNRSRDGEFSPTAQLDQGHVIVLDVKGNVIARSKLLLPPTVIALSPDAQRFAFFGPPPVLRTRETTGIYVAGVHETQASKLIDVSTTQASADSTTRPILDWSPDNQSILYSARKSVWLVNTQSHQLTKLADGGWAKWSPSGEWISYVTVTGEAALLNTSTREVKVIDKGHRVLSPIEWSPDGKYVLIQEGEGSHVPYGCLWVYRISDGAFAPIPYYGIGGPRPQWIRLGL